MPTAFWCMYTRTRAFFGVGVWSVSYTLRITPSLWTWRVHSMMTWNFYKFCFESIAALAGVALPSTSRSNFLSGIRNCTRFCLEPIPALAGVVPNSLPTTLSNAILHAQDARDCNRFCLEPIQALAGVVPRSSHSVVECTGVRLHCKP